MIIAFRPELQNPAMDKECSIGFSFIGKNGKETSYYNLESGVTRDFPEDVWEKIKDKDVVKQLLAWRALEVIEEKEVQKEVKRVTKAKAATVSDLPLDEAMKLIEASFDKNQLGQWNANDDRIPVKNAAAKRIEAITAGKA
jgi:hypothetical protein